jgi:subtilase family serine protease
MTVFPVRCLVRSFLRTAPVALVMLGLCGLHAVSAQSLSDNTPGFIRHAKDLGETNLSTMMTATVWLNLHNESLLDQLVSNQYNKKSASFHQWISQSDFNKNFSPTSQEVNAVQHFLSAHGLSVVETAENNFYVKAEGTVADMEKTFHVSIHNYSYKGQTYRSNTGDPSVDNSSGGHIAGVTGLDDLGYEPLNQLPTAPDGTPLPMRPVTVSPEGAFFEGQCFRGLQTQTFTNSPALITATYTGNRYGADITNTNFGHLAPCGYQPFEVDLAYNMFPLFEAGLDGAGETIVIVDAYGSPTIESDALAFSEIYGLPLITSENFAIVKGGGLVNSPKGPPKNWNIETTLDVEWAHAVAPGANIALVLTTDNGSLEEGVNLAVVHHLGNTISNSWSMVEGLGNPMRFNRMQRILKQAAAEGIDVNFASGDFGDETVRVGFTSVDFPASSPLATAVGGTSLALNPDDSIMFQTGWGNNVTFIAEPAALNNVPVVPPANFGFQGGAGGGSSGVFAKPAFQSGLAGTTRQVPDISMVADPFTGVEIIITLNGQLLVGVVGGTSLATPVFSAVMAVAAQKNGHVGFGQAAPLLYELPAALPPFGPTVTDVVPFPSPNNVTGTITVDGIPFGISADQLAAPLGNTTSFVSALYNSPIDTAWYVLTFGTDTSLVVTPGWDNVTGLGTPNGTAFVLALAP